MEGADNDRILFAEFQLDRAHRKLYRSGEPVQLYAKALDLLEFLVEHNGRVVSKNEIFEKVWPDQFVEEANLSVQISALRKGLGEKKDEPRFLITVPGVGYKFIASDLRTETSEPNIQPASLGETSSENEFAASITGVPPPVAETIVGSRPIVFAAAALAGILLLTFLGYRYVYEAPGHQIRSLAVLPFAGQDRDPKFEYLGDGLAESVIHSLSGSPDLRVMSRNSAFRFRGSEADAKEIGRELNVDAVLIGRIVSSGNKLSISTELISTTDNSVIWGEQFTRESADIERLQNDIARSISQRLKLRLSGGASPRGDRQSSDPEVYRLTLLGRFHLNMLTDENFLKGRDYFQQAIDKDSNYAPAYAGLAEAYSRLSGWNAIPPNEGYPKARTAAERALELDDQLAEAHATLGMVRHFYDWDWAGAEKELRRAIEINPNNADAHQAYGYYLSAMERFDEAVVQMELSLKLDPLSVEKNAGIGELAYLRRDYDRAIEQYNKLLETNPTSGFLHWAIGNVYVQKGMYGPAIAAYQKAIPLSGDSPDEPASLAFAYALSGNRTEAARLAKDLELRSKKTYVSPASIAVIYSGLGDKDRAFEYLEKAYERRDMLLVLLKVEPMFDRLRDDERFANLIGRVGF
ncbi:MAG: winged helix-turn-helix domain-containing protein [Acidobacteriota bacterium]